jgi:SAM-dependent methyltransferase
MNERRRYKHTSHTETIARVLRSEGVTSDRQLARALVTVAHGFGSDEEFIRYADADAFTRVYTLRKVADRLGRRHPRSIVEVCSGADISAALAFSQSTIYSIDWRQVDFLSNPNNSLPKGVFEAFGRKKIPEPGKSSRRRRKAKLAFVQECVPNFKPVVANAQRLPFLNESMDMALIQGQVHPQPFLPELARVLKQGGVLVRAVHDVHRSLKASSFYETGRFNGPAESYFFSDRSYAANRIGKVEQIASSVGFRQVSIPSDLRGYEDAARYTRWGEKFSIGVVFQVFRKE